MIDITKVPIGTMLYQADERNESFKQKRIFMTDGEGLEWYRYDRSRHSYHVHKYILTGAVYKTVVGEVAYDDHGDEYHLRYVEDGKIYEHAAKDELFDECFLTEQAALDRIEEMKAARKA